MPDKITPATATGAPTTTGAPTATGTGTTTGIGTGTGTVRGLNLGRGLGVGCLGCGGLVAVLVLVLAAVLVWNAGDATDLPRVAPDDRADRAFAYSREAYDVMGFTRTLPPGAAGAGTRNTFGAEHCRDGGLLGMEDKTVDGAYRLYHEWALDHVPAGQAVAGLRRLHRRLSDEGWRVTSYTEGGNGKDWSLYVQRDHRAEWMTFTWDPERRYFTGGAGVPCAYDPAWTHSDIESYDPYTAARAVSSRELRPGRR
ncbi:hypothetical protein [Streptomyces sp. NPDC002343]